MFKTIMLIDGENLVARYQDMLKDGRKPKNEVVHEKDIFVWHPNIFFGTVNDVVRVAFYQTVVGDDTKVDTCRDDIAKLGYNFINSTKSSGHGTLVPYVFKKENRNSKTKSVDINITVDALQYAYGSAVEKIIFVSGDGDYIPLFKAIMARGKAVQVYAFSSGLNKDIKRCVDDLILLDGLFFDR